MSEIVDRIRALCEKQGTSFYSLEKSTGLGNGTIGKWKSRKPSYENIAKVAAALGTTPEYLMTGETKTEAPMEASEIGMDDFTYALQNEAKGLTDADKELLLSMARQLREARRKNHEQTG